MSKSIIEKLGVTGGEWAIDDEENSIFGVDDYHCITSGDGYFNRKKGGFDFTGYSSTPDVRLIASAPEMLEALIRGIIANEALSLPLESMYRAVEKATGKSWDEIKELI